MTRRTILSCVLVLLPTVLAAAMSDAAVPPAGSGVAQAPEVKTEGLVNVARLDITSVCASSVNGKRPLDDKFYGVLNLFDGGENFINNINYTYWVPDAEPEHLVILSFRKPVTVHSVSVETTDRNRPAHFRLLIGHLTAERRQENSDLGVIPVKDLRTTHALPQPLNSVNYIHIWLPGPNIIEVAEIEVMGSPPAGADVTAQKPRIVQPLTDVHRLNVLRRAATDEERRMIVLAESAYPPRADVLEAVRTAHFRLDEVPADEKLWWFSSFDTVRIPYAVTAEAVDYYTTLIQRYRMGELANFVAKRSSFEYEADVHVFDLYRTEGKVFENVYVVKMRLSFSAYWGPEAALGFRKERTVILDRGGRVLLITGDGKTECIVS